MAKIVPKQTTVRHQEVLADCRKLLRRYGYWHFKVLGGRFRVGERIIGTPVGIPDIIACIDGVLWGIECKTPSDRVTPAQQRQMNAIAESGGMAVVVYSAQELAEIIEAWRKSRE